MIRVDTTLTGVGGSPYFSRLHFQGDTEADAIACSDAVREMWVDLFTGINPAVGRLTAQVQEEVSNVNPADGNVLQVFTVEQDPVPPGSSDVAIVPNAAQGLVRLRTQTFLDGRRVLGKFYVPCLNVQSQTAAGDLGSTTPTILIAAVSPLLGVDLVVWSRPKDSPARVGSVAVVTSLNVWSEFAVLRSRRD